MTQPQLHGFDFHWRFAITVLTLWMLQMLESVASRPGRQRALNAAYAATAGAYFYELGISGTLIIGETFLFLALAIIGCVELANNDWRWTWRTGSIAIAMAALVIQRVLVDMSTEASVNGIAQTQ